MFRPFQAPISPHLSPNATGSSLVLALSYLANPLRWPLWKRGKNVTRLERRFATDHEASEALAVDSGRTALKLILEPLGLTQGDEVVTQAFTCIVVPNAIAAAGATPRYLDIDDSYNLDPKQLEDALGKPDSRIRAVIVQHTFGVPGQISRIKEICSNHDVTLIEDCAHSLGATVDGKLVGTFGDAAMFSFGRDKVISSVSGGLAIASNPKIAEALRVARSTMPLPKRTWIAQRFMHPLIFAVAKRLYYTFSLGKVIIVASRKLHLVPDVLDAGEKEGTPQQSEFRLPNSLAHWAMQQYELLPVYNAHRQDIADLYRKELSFPAQHIYPDSEPIFLRYSIEVQNQKALLKEARSVGILLGDWYTDVIVPCTTPLATIGYSAGSCPKAEQLASRAINLPTSPRTSNRHATRVTQLIHSQAE